MVGAGGRPAFDPDAPPPDFEALRDNVPNSFRVPSAMTRDIARAKLLACLMWFLRLFGLETHDAN